MAEEQERTDGPETRGEEREIKGGEIPRKEEVKWKGKDVRKRQREDGEVFLLLMYTDRKL